MSSQSLITRVKKELAEFNIKASCQIKLNGKLTKIVATVTEDTLKFLTENEQELIEKGYAFTLYGLPKDHIISPLLPSELKEIFSVELETIFFRD